MGAAPDPLRILTAAGCRWRGLRASRWWRVSAHVPGLGSLTTDQHRSFEAAIRALTDFLQNEAIFLPGRVVFMQPDEGGAVLDSAHRRRVQSS
jgi:hypothetical protein